MGNNIRKNPWYKKNVPQMMDAIKDAYVQGRMALQSKMFAKPFEFQLIFREYKEFFQHGEGSHIQAGIDSEVLALEDKMKFESDAFDSLVKEMEDIARSTKVRFGIDRSHYFLKVMRLKYLVWAEWIKWNRDTLAETRFINELKTMKADIRDLDEQTEYTKDLFKRMKKLEMKYFNSRKARLKKYNRYFDIYIEERVANREGGNNQGLGIYLSKSGSNKKETKKGIFTAMITEDSWVDPFRGRDTGHLADSFSKWYFCRVASSSLLKRWLRKFGINKTEDYLALFVDYPDYFLGGMTVTSDLPKLIHDQFFDTMYFGHYWNFEDYNNVQSMKDIVYKEQNPYQLRDILSELEETEKEKMEQEDRQKVVTELTWGLTLVDCKTNRNFFWEDLDTPQDRLEANVMGHCGTASGDHDKSTLISLRQFHPGPKRPEGYGWPEWAEEYLEFNKEGKYETLDEIATEMIKHGDYFTVHLTATMVKAGKYRLLSESKGYGNSKPSKTYYPQIIELLEDEQFIMVCGGGYMSELNFHLTDLDQKDYDKLIKKKPWLVSFRAFAKYYGNEALFRDVLGLELDKYPIHKGKTQIFKGYFDQFLTFCNEEIITNDYIEYRDEYYFERYRERGQNNYYVNQGILDIIDHIKRWLDEGIEPDRYDGFDIDQLEHNDVKVKSILIQLAKKAVKKPDVIEEYLKNAEDDEELSDHVGWVDEFEEMRDQLIFTYREYYADGANSNQYDAVRKKLISSMNDDFNLNIYDDSQTHEIVITADPNDIIDKLDERTSSESADENLNFNVDEFLFKPNPDADPITMDWFFRILEEYDYPEEDADNSELFDGLADRLSWEKEWEFPEDLSFDEDEDYDD